MSLGDDNDGFGGSGQTRTRLPEGGTGDVYGGARRPPARTSRSLVTVVGVVVLLIAAIAFANRGGAGDETGDNAAASSSAPGAPAPTAATGVRPVTGKNGTIPTGFARDEQGAQSAAVNYSVPLGSADMFVASRRHEIVNSVYAPAAAAERGDDLDKVYSDKGFLARIGLQEDGTAPSGLTFISRVIPVGSKIESYSSDRATVAVWFSSLFGMAGEGSTNPVSESWYTTTYQLQWVGGDWKVTDFDQKDGPVPVGRDQRASSAEEMADAVDQFGGFTYAR
ncbi:hypothetical protein ACFYV5_19845 [Streptomyces sp. NPDC003035]|uniref:hypothetical protein n=1 Tax=Streptomyces sp. NPDC003035 TaxID=3364676 RepID=UPI0036AFF1A9